MFLAIHCVVDHITSQMAELINACAMLDIYEWSLLEIMRKATGSLTAVIAALAKAVQFQACPLSVRVQAAIHASRN